MPVPDDDFMNKSKHVARFGQSKVLSENALEIDGLFVRSYITKECLIITLTTPLYIMTLICMHCHKFYHWRDLSFSQQCG